MGVLVVMIPTHKLAIGVYYLVSLLNHWVQHSVSLAQVAVVTLADWQTQKLDEEAKMVCSVKYGRFKIIQKQDCK